ncbi:2-C-methyl-D-erythritol 4-phosphate cytidylyltransferase [Desulfovibrio sp.]|uniref:2-C-methyl-D-erythritol 4-phosphate cytidylyltransferase n=1 Tax=Desulfovibrio sp. TaxID=885 RepID=UPI0023D0A5FD|nr:2-C-methyl-D-erythritol 4-phosphate cytidylyltransferase [Desulfovibrio sp.]MDE7240684.1 2-C-methyl-D-erythritol 4-phosphate cytidylyltransferase [Desulfovibrio sp.]
MVLAAGSGSRLAGALQGRAKQFEPFDGAPLYWRSAQVFAQSGAVGGIVLVFPGSVREAEAARIASLPAGDDLGIPWIAVAGGAQRQDSVRLGLAAVPPTVRHVLIHDAARPFVSAALVRRICAALAEDAPAVIPGLPVTDTIKLVDAAAPELVAETLPRHRLRAVQTPQGFDAALLREAHERARDGDAPATDDAALMEACGHPVRIIPGEAENVKITNPQDLALLRGPAPAPMPCSGLGYDVHRFGGDRPLMLGGVEIAGAPGVLAHSDGDVLLHALMDAILGCASLGDIGQHFPDSDPALSGISSALLLDRVLELASGAGLEICHVDMTLVAQKPRLAPWREEIRANVARLLGLARNQVNLKATTEEGLGFTGRGEGIKAWALVSAARKAGD